MPEGKILTFSKNEYPEMDGHEDGTEVTMKIKGKLKNNDNAIDITIQSFDFDAGNSADKEMERMTGKKKVSATSEMEEEDDF